MPFTLSVGDFLTTAKLIKDIISCLRKSSTAEFRELSLELDSLQRALYEIEHLKCRPNQDAAVNGIKVAALLCQYPLDEFAGKLKKYEDLGTLQRPGAENKGLFSLWGKKLKWGFTMQEEVRNLRAYLVAHTGSLNMRLLTQGM